MINDVVRALTRRPGDDFTDVVVRVQDRTVEAGWADLERPIKHSQEYVVGSGDIKHGNDEFRGDSRLSLLVGAFEAAADYLPMGPYELIRWVDRRDERLSGRQFIDGFVAMRLLDAPPLHELNDEQLNDLELIVRDEKSERAHAAKAELERLAEFERRARANLDSKQAMIEDALSGASIEEVSGAVTNSFVPENLQAIGLDILDFVDRN